MKINYANIFAYNVYMHAFMSTAIVIEWADVLKWDKDCLMYEHVSWLSKAGRQINTIDH